MFFYRIQHSTPSKGFGVVVLYFSARGSWSFLVIMFSISRSLMENIYGRWNVLTLVSCYLASAACMCYICEFVPLSDQSFVRYQCAFGCCCMRYRRFQSIFLLIERAHQCRLSQWTLFPFLPLFLPQYVIFANYRDFIHVPQLSVVFLRLCSNVLHACFSTSALSLCHSEFFVSVLFTLEISVVLGYHSSVRCLTWLSSCTPSSIFCAYLMRIPLSCYSDFVLSNLIDLVSSVTQCVSFLEDCFPLWNIYGIECYLIVLVSSILYLQGAEISYSVVPSAMNL